MKAARLVGPRQFEILDAEVPTPADGQCLIKLEKISVCGSDIRHEYSHLFPEDHYPGRLGVPGHECAGVVVESRTQEYREGQRVIIYPGRGVNSGGLVEYIASGPEWMCALPDEGDLTEWVICQPLRHRPLLGAADGQPAGQGRSGSGAGSHRPVLHHAMRQAGSLPGGGH